VVEILDGTLSAKGMLVWLLEVKRSESEHLRLHKLVALGLVVRYVSRYPVTHSAAAVMIL
jgi:hypothetical protein